MSLTSSDPWITIDHAIIKSITFKDTYGEIERWPLMEAPRVEELPSPSEVLLAAKDRLESDGWAKGSYQNRDGQYCSVGAVVASLRLTGRFWSTQHPQLVILADRCYFYLARAIGTHQSIISLSDRGRVMDWNDYTETTFQDVLDVFTHAIKYAEEDEAE